MSEDVVQRIEFEKTERGTTVSCTLEQFDDGSVYVVGEEFGELVFEFAPDNVASAITHLEKEGYVRRPLPE